MFVFIIYVFNHGELITYQHQIPKDEDEDEEKETIAPFPNPEKVIQIFVKTLEGKSVSLYAGDTNRFRVRNILTLFREVDPGWTGKIFKQACRAKLGATGKLPTRYTYGGRIIQDELVLDSLNIQAGSTVFQMADFAVRTGQTKQYIVMDRFGREHSVTMKDNKTVYDMKLKLWDLTSESPSTFSLWTNLRAGGDGFRFGTILKDNKFLYAYTPDIIEMDIPYKSDKTKYATVRFLSVSW
jgi:hypothetical protein